jgi:hypothetical protein
MEVTNDGIFVYIKDAMFPYKSFPTPDSVFAVNVVKALFIESVKLLSKWYYLFTLFFLLKDRHELIESINRIGWKIISPYVLKYQYLTKFSKTLHFIVFTFLNQLGINEKSADRLATIFVHLIEYDNAYRLRIADIMTYSSKEKFANNTQKEIKKLIGILEDRDGIQVSSKFSRFAKLIHYALYIPKVKKALIKAVVDSDFDDLKADESDKYWCVIRTDYKFMGMTNEQRQEYAKSKGWTYPLPKAKDML